MFLQGLKTIVFQCLNAKIAISQRFNLSKQDVLMLFFCLKISSGY